MSAALEPASRRFEQAESSRLAWAFVLSIILHLLISGTYEAGKKFGWWQNIHWPAWTHSSRMLTEILKKATPQQPKTQEESPYLFVDVSHAQATPEPPKTTPYYSDKNSRAANPDSSADTDTPKIEGKQTVMVKTEDVPRANFAPLQPARPADDSKKEQEEMKPKPQEKPGDLVMAKPDLNPPKDPGKAEQARPRTLQEARARLRDNRLPGEKMKQEGGVRRHLEIASLDAKATPFGAYDAMLVEAISQRWFALLEERDYASSDGRGKVVLQFSLHHDGRISDMNVAENTAGEVLGLLCEKAVLDPAPFAPWPIDLRRTLGDIRNIQFTFYYSYN
jgi:hypothetical protein